MDRVDEVNFWKIQADNEHRFTALEVRGTVSDAVIAKLSDKIDKLGDVEENLKRAVDLLSGKLDRTRR